MSMAVISLMVWAWAFALLAVTWGRYLRLVRELDAFRAHLERLNTSIAKADATLERNSYIREGLR